MHRATVLRLLREHQPRAADPHEAAMTAEIIRFVEAHADCLERTCVPGHLTGSAWIVDPARRRVLLVHHRKLDRWLQPGGHADGDPHTLFDVDRHWIPVHGDTPGHHHLDLRFLLEADPEEQPVVSEESHDVRWVDLDQVAAFNPEESMLRMVWKTGTT